MECKNVDRINKHAIFSPRLDLPMPENIGLTARHVFLQMARVSSAPETRAVYATIFRAWIETEYAILRARSSTGNDGGQTEIPAHNDGPWDECGPDEPHPRPRCSENAGAYDNHHYYSAIIIIIFRPSPLPPSVLAEAGLFAFPLLLLSVVHRVEVAAVATAGFTTDKYSWRALSIGR
jgi:hypothetical protein